MADVYAAFGTLLALGIAFPGLLTGAWLLFPGMVGRARMRATATPLRSLFLGIGAALLTAIPVSILGSVPLGLFKLAAALVAFGALGLATIGAAGIAAEMGDRLRSSGPSSMSPSGAFVRGAIALELAAIFPLVGWFLMIPGTLLVGYGAGVFALLRWMPRPAFAPRVEPAASGA